MQIINLDKWSGSYAEIGQTNPLRWQNLKLVGEGVYEPVSHKWKCKDFMNEVVTSYHTKRDFSIYGFTVKHSTFFDSLQNELPILLHNVLPGFDSNMKVVNKYLNDQGILDVLVLPAPTGPTTRFIQIDGHALMNTFFMSQVTLFIRLANTEKVYQSLQEMCNDPLNKQDANNLAACFKKPIKDFPKALEDYIWYYDDQRNLKHGADKSTTIQTSLMHNCGVVSWGWTTEEECV
jgi:hypothetical protein